MTTNAVTSEGLITQQLDEIIERLKDDFRSIYGTDINLESNSPDGQLIGILAQLKADLLDLITQVYNSFDPDVAEGAALDARVALNGIQRRGASYTLVTVEVTTDRALTLYGLDQSVRQVFTVSDDAGQNFLLQETQTISAAGTYAYTFRAENPGAVQVAAGTIKNQKTVVLGVTDVNNPAGADVVGEDEESDADLRLRRQVSLAIGANNSVDSLRSALANLNGVTDVYVHENYTNTTDAYGVGEHSIWAIVEGGADSDIGETIYAKKSAGCGMHGSEEVEVEMPTGDIFTAKFDRPIYVPLHIRFSLTKRIPTASYDADVVKAELASRLKYKLFEKADAADITQILLEILPYYIPSNVEISVNETDWYEIISPDDPQHKFSVSASNISIL